MSPDEEIIGKEPLITLDSINDLNSINEEDSLYIIRLLTDEDTLNLLIELKKLYRSYIKLKQQSYELEIGL